MPNFRRNYVPGGTYFFTVVTHGRRPFLTSALARRCLRHALAGVLRTRPFVPVAVVLLPDHLHAIWTLPDGDADFSSRWGRVKEEFTRGYLRAGGEDGTPTANRVRHRERAVWQHRFWEHTVRDPDDFSRCLDYLHWNPVKHGLVTRAADYPWSTLRKFVALGEYDPEWGSGVEVRDVPGAEWE